MILGVGMVLASAIFPELKASMVKDGATDWQTLFLVPTGLAALGVMLMAFFFHPPSRRPADAAAVAH